MTSPEKRLTARKETERLDTLLVSLFREMANFRFRFQIVDFTFVRLITQQVDLDI